MSYQHSLDRLREAIQRLSLSANELETIEVPAEDQALLETTITTIQTARDACAAMEQAIQRKRAGL
jgi:VCBS repeat-containing protein